MKCSVIGCQNERHELGEEPRGRYCDWCSDCCKINRRPDYMADYENPDNVVVSEYEAYQAWRHIGVRELTLDIEENHVFSDDEVDSALFGWWNEKVRR